MINKVIIFMLTFATLAGCKQSKTNMEDSQKEIIESYISSYNSFDVDGMLKNLNENIVFENISNGVVEMKLEGINAFKDQAIAATKYFQEREQKITSWEFNEMVVSVLIDYQGILAIELPNGMKPGDTLKLKGKSTFTFLDKTVVKIVDES